MNRINYQKALERILEGLPGTDKDGRENPPKRLLLHSCCAPCSSYVLEYLRDYFRITVLYYNPNITDRAEYGKRVEEQRRLIERMNEERPSSACPISLEEGDYAPERFFSAVRGVEHILEGGERCYRCFELRLRETARRAAEGGYDFYTTTLTISPLKNAQWLNEIGERLGKEYGAAFLPSDFKKRDGYKRSVELSEQYGLYRQDYCGCIFSQKEREAVLQP